MTSGAGHYFDDDPSVASSPRTVELVLPDLHVQLVTDRGVFSGDRVDPGTRYLLIEAPAPRPGVGQILDLGCGYGPIARTLAHRSPGATVWAIDVNERARQLAARNLDGLDVVVADPDDVPADMQFDLIWSNPPIRIGKPALHKLLETWLDRLTSDGVAILVVQKHLGADTLATWLDDSGWATRRLGSRQGYRLLEVRPR